MEHIRNPGRSVGVIGGERKAISLVVALALVLSTGLALPAQADPPVAETWTDVFTDVNPCSGENHELTISNEARVHQHPNNTVIIASRTGTTDSGFEMVSGTLHLVRGESTVGLTDVWHNPTTGEKLVAHVTVVLDPNTLTVRIERVSLRCLG
jgi:hypothetical protein